MEKQLKNLVGKRVDVSDVRFCVEGILEKYDEKRFAIYNDDSCVLFVAARVREIRERNPGKWSITLK
jgi:hypothetical protein